MKAAVYEINGDPEVLRYEEIADPIVGPGDVLIAVEAISVEGGDVHHRRLVPVSAPYVVGYAAAGVVRAVGAEVTLFTVGQRVAAFNWNGSHAELCSVPEHFVYAVPDALPIEVAATIPVAFGTAHDALFEFGQLREGETILVRGGAGGVGLGAIQLAKEAGADVIATASSGAQAQKLRNIGAHHVVNYTADDVAAAILALTGGEGVALMVDMAGGADVPALLGAVRRRGRVSAVGMSAGQPSLSYMDLIGRMLTISGISFGTEMHLPRARAVVEDCLRRAAKGALMMPIDRIYRLDDAAAAHRHAEFERPFGRVLMRPVCR
ncbi:zinc-binding alcohol dehydrogenase family protein [Mycolicibacterium peregrinum]|uniref:Zinc-binding alcohol dehydrogenase family protein n=1 Tax=Mycolicibacterium peregrinum TaxID=43304 RepID=A0A4Z0HT75_MYCPR|nr:zinc-binding alcohol dehydrogenase family protein [Mycolicibacterium peregrinum]TGB44278.1 zinc-binding alcohol dehydrogenase family protein [Mycolicibacterium peregrinum]